MQIFVKTSNNNKLIGKSGFLPVQTVFQKNLMGSKLGQDQSSIFLREVPINSMSVILLTNRRTMGKNSHENNTSPGGGNNITKKKTKKIQ